MKFRKKPIVIEAEQYNGPSDILAHAGALPPVPDGVKWDVLDTTGIKYPLIETLEGRLLVCPGDWIITGIKGEKYPCKPDIFAATYEPVTK